MTTHTGPSGLYWLFAGLLVLFGLVGILSIGWPFLVLGFTLMALAPVRSRPRAFWPSVTGVVAFLLTFAVVAPFSCTLKMAFVDPRGGAQRRVALDETTCSNLLGFDYSVPPNDDPSIVPALGAALVVGTAAAAAASVIVARSESHRT